ncbi:MAG: polynucleotide adenylyltransferase PcnB [Pseudomonadota bacterium]
MTSGPTRNSRTCQDSPTISPRIIPRAEHNISRANISEHALKVLYRLTQAGHEAYLVGGGVRDLLLGQSPKDFDVATSARPDEVKALFRNCRLIGRRFVLAHVRFGREVIEVATFRAAHDADDGDGRTENGMIVRDNVYGTRDEDAARRDFSINCLYYDIRDFSVVDFADGVDDLEHGIIRMLGEPESRYREDPVRILRALRFAAKLDFELETRTLAAIAPCAGLLADIPPARLFEECLKLLMTGHALASFRRLREHDILRTLFPATASLIEEDERALALVELALGNTDQRVAEDKPVTPAFLLAALLWPVLRVHLAGHEVQDMSPGQAIEQAGSQVVFDQNQVVAVPKRFSLMAREIWNLQPRLLDRRGRRPQKLADHPRLRAAYDFLLLRAEAGEPVEEDAAWWTKFLESRGDGNASAQSAPRDGERRRRRRRRSRRGPPAARDATAQ